MQACYGSTMLGRLKAFFEDRDGDAASGDEHNLEEKHLAAAALMVEAAVLDEDFGDEERAAIRRAIESAFKLGGEDADALLAEAEKRQDDSNQIFHFTHTIKEHFSEPERIELIELLWEVVYADGVLHELEANLMRRIGGLIYVSDKDRGLARKRVLARLGLT